MEGAGQTKIKEPIVTEFAHQPRHASEAREPAKCQVRLKDALANSWQAISLLPRQADRDNNLEFLLKTFMANIGADYTFLTVIDEASGRDFIRSRPGDARPGWEKLCLSLPRPAAPTRFDVSENGPGTERLFAGAGISAVLCVPIMVEGKATGALYGVRAADREVFTAADLDFASILGKLSGPIIENARLSFICDKQHLQMDILLCEMSNAHEAERKRVADEIHDSVAQWMVGATYSIRACEALVSAARFGELQHELNKVDNILRKSMKEIRRVIANLSSSPLKQLGFVGALQQIAETLSEDGINCRVDIEPRLPRINANEEAITYLIIQEALNNVRKHSQATGVSVRVYFRDNTISVEICDDGKGFDVNEVMSSTTALEHIGLRSMKERAGMLGGHLSIKSEPRKGTSLAFTIPYPCLVQI